MSNTTKKLKKMYETWASMTKYQKNCFSPSRTFFTPIYSNFLHFL